MSITLTAVASVYARIPFHIANFKLNLLNPYGNIYKTRLVLTQLEIRI
jgi:hypothetical protein